MIAGQPEGYYLTHEQYVKLWEKIRDSYSTQAASSEFVKEMRKHPAPDVFGIREKVLEEIVRTVEKLYDDGFRNPLVTVKCAVAYMKDPTVPGHPEKQKHQRGEQP